MDLTRKQFLHYFAGAGAAALGVSVLGACDDDSGGKPPDAPPAADAPPADAAIDAPIDSAVTSCTMNGTVPTIGTNHGHAFAMAVTKEDVIAGVNKTYNIQGTSGHPHTVTVTAAMFTMLQQNMQVTVKSSFDASHDHDVTIRCA
jgi:hypothetical protein